MHCIGASVCLWMYTIINETLDSLVMKYFHRKIINCDGDGDDDDDFFLKLSSNMSLFVSGLSAFSNGSSAERPYGAYIGECISESSTKFDLNHAVCLLHRRHMCSNNGDITAGLFTAAPLLYPFSIEFK